MSCWHTVSIECCWTVNWRSSEKRVRSKGVFISEGPARLPDGGKLKLYIWAHFIWPRNLEPLERKILSRNKIKRERISQYFLLLEHGFHSDLPLLSLLCVLFHTTTLLNLTLVLPLLPLRTWLVEQLLTSYVYYNNNQIFMIEC